MADTPLTSPGRVFLDRIVQATQNRIERLRLRCKPEDLQSVGRSFPKRSLAVALRSSTPSVIAEIKQASPSKGRFREDFDHMNLAREYSQGGAAALSVVTEPEFFLGQETWLTEIRNATSLPILRKDFILAPLQIAETAALGADAILLIARLLSVEQLRELSHAATVEKLEVLFEAHDEDDLEKIAECGPRMVGINARNLDTFVVDTLQFEQLRSLIPQGAVAVAESGIESGVQIRSAFRLGYQGFLIGETLIKSHDPATLIRELRMEAIG